MTVELYFVNNTAFETEVLLRDPLRNRFESIKRTPKVFSLRTRVGLVFIHFDFELITLRIFCLSQILIFISTKLG